MYINCMIELERVLNRSEEVSKRVQSIFINFLEHGKFYLKKMFTSDEF